MVIMVQCRDGKEREFIREGNLKISPAGSLGHVEIGKDELSGFAVRRGDAWRFIAFRPSRYATLHNKHRKRLNKIISRIRWRHENPYPFVYHWRQPEGLKGKPCKVGEFYNDPRYIQIIFEDGRKITGPASSLRRKDGFQ